MINQNNAELKIAEELIILNKKMFKHFTNIEMDFAKQLITIEERLSNLKGNNLTPAPEKTSKDIDKPKEVIKTPLSDEEKKLLDKGKLPLNNNFDSQHPEVIPEKPTVDKKNLF